MDNIRVHAHTTHHMTDEQIERRVVEERNSDFIQKAVNRDGLLVSQSTILPGC